MLHEAGFFVSAVNPLLIKEYGGNSLRKVKTDKADAVKIARYALDNWADLRDYTPMDRIRYDLKTLNRQFHLTSKQKTATANNLIALLEQSFPGVRQCFDSPVRRDETQKWVDFAHDFWHADFAVSSSMFYPIGISIISVVKLHEYPMLVHISFPTLASFQIRYDTDGIINIYIYRAL